MNKDDLDDEKWFDALTGRAPNETDSLSESEREGLILRNAILSRHKKVSEHTEEPKQEDLERLLFKIRKKTAQSKKNKSATFWGMPVPVAIAAGIAVVAILPFTFQNTNEQAPLQPNIDAPVAHAPKMFDSPPAKASIEQLSIIRSSAPETTLLEISKELKKLNITYQASQLNGEWHLDAKVDSKKIPPQLISLAEEYDFNITDDGHINLIFKTD